MWSLLFLGAASAAGITSYYDDIKEFKCYSLKGDNSTGGLNCVVPVNQAGECFFFCSNPQTSINAEKVGKLSLDGKASKQPVCTINFNGGCIAAVYPTLGPPVACYSAVKTPATFTDAVADCKKSDNGVIYVPDSDGDLESQIGLLSAKVSSLWLGGGTVFFRSCGRHLPEKGDKEAVEVATVFTKESKGNTFGYTTSRLATEKHAYICAKKCEMKFFPPTGPAAGDPVQSAPIVNTPPEICILSPTVIKNGYQPLNTYRQACIPGGPLGFGDSITVVTKQMAWKGSKRGFTINLLNKDYEIPFHFVIDVDGKQNLAMSRGRWGSTDGTQVNFTNPFIYNVEKEDKTVITNTASQLVIVANDKETFNYPHQTKNPATDYVYLAFQAYPVEIASVTVTRKGVTTPLPISNKSVTLVLPPLKN